MGKLSVLGIVRYVGAVDGEEGTFIGLEMESGGDTTGTYNGKTYFEGTIPFLLFQKTFFHHFFLSCFRR